MELNDVNFSMRKPFNDCLKQPVEQDSVAGRTRALARYFSEYPMPHAVTIYTTSIFVPSMHIGLESF